MKKLKFDIFIGRPMILNQNENVNAVVIPCFYLPRGKCNIDGSEAKASDICFQNLFDLGTYIADWIDLLGKENISATIYLNTRSNQKSFTGLTIIDLIDKIAQTADYKSIKNFRELL